MCSLSSNDKVIAYVYFSKCSSVFYQVLSFEVNELWKMFLMRLMFIFFQNAFHCILLDGTSMQNTCHVFINLDGGYTVNHLPLPHSRISLPSSHYNPLSFKTVLLHLPVTQRLPDKNDAWFTLVQHI